MQQQDVINLLKNISNSNGKGVDDGIKFLQELGKMVGVEIVTSMPYEESDSSTETNSEEVQEPDFVKMAISLAREFFQVNSDLYSPPKEQLVFLILKEALNKKSPDKPLSLSLSPYHLDIVSNNLSKLYDFIYEKDMQEIQKTNPSPIVHKVNDKMTLRELYAHLCDVGFDVNEAPPFNVVENSTFLSEILYQGHKLGKVYRKDNKLVFTVDGQEEALFQDKEAQVVEWNHYLHLMQNLLNSNAEKKGIVEMAEGIITQSQKVDETQEVYEVYTSKQNELKSIMSDILNHNTIILN